MMFHDYLSERQHYDHPFLRLICILAKCYLMKALHKWFQEPQLYERQMDGKEEPCVDLEAEMDQSYLRQDLHQSVQRHHYVH